MKRKYLKNSSGFTLVELMVTVLLTAIAVIAIYRGYTSFSQSADAQQQVIEMQQNLRIGMYTLAKDIMRAGMKEEEDELVAFTNADTNTVTFVMDLGSGGVFAADGKDNDGDGVEDDDPDSAIAAREAEEEGRIGDGDVEDDGEKIRYSLDDEDINDNGILDTGEDVNGNEVLDRWLQREVWDAASADYDPPQTIITNVSALNFVYLDVDGNPTAVMENIDTVEITLVVRTTNEDYRITNTETYANQLGTWSWTSPGDNFRRRSMSMRVKVRNAQL